MLSRVSVLVFLIVLAACEKPVQPVPDPPVNTHPQMHYTNLSDTAIIFGRAASFDLDGDGTRDVYFATQLVGDPLAQQDKRQWLVGGGINTFLPISITEAIPVMQAMDDIPVNSFAGYTWYNAPEILLAEKVISMNIPPFWRGDWKETAHRFIPIQIKTNNALYLGWIEVSFSIDNEKLILHKAAIAKEPGKAVKASK